MMKIENLSKSFGRSEVLKMVDLHLPKGKIIGIVGENGAGKTTLFRCIVGLENYEGSIVYGNENIKNITGYLPTTPLMLPYITGKEYIDLVCKARNVVINNIQERNIFDLPLKEYAAQYSTGMKKKLALLALLLCDNEIYVLDEPFNGIDINSNIVIDAILRELKSKNKTIILSSHLMTSLKATCDELHLLANGVIARSAYTKPEFEDVELSLISKAKTDIVQKIWP